MLRIITYYTKNSIYEEQFFEVFEPSMKRFDLPYEAYAVEDKGSWIKNVSIKPAIIFTALEKYNRRIVFLDVDAEVVDFPSLFFKAGKFDIGFHYLDWYLYWRGKPGNKKELLSGTLLFDPTEKAFEILRKWKNLCTKEDNWDQRYLQQVIESMHDLSILEIPIEYIVIVKRDGRIPSFIKKPIIVHHQLSRKVKK